MKKKIILGTLFAAFVLGVNYGVQKLLPPPGTAISSKPEAPGAHWRNLDITRLNVREEAPFFKLPTPGGEMLGPASFKGKVVFLNLWATWCPPCTAEMPAMDRLYKKYKDKGFVILGANFKENRRTVEAFMEERKLSFPTVMDTYGILQNKYKIIGFPTSVLIDKEGKVAAFVLGSRQWDNPYAEAIVEELLAE